MEKNQFNKKKADLPRNADDLEKYVRVTNPGVWMILAACLALLLGLLAWGIWGEVSSSVEAMGVSMNGETLCMLSAEDVTRIAVGYSASFGGLPMTVSDIAGIPISRKEAEEIFGNDYLVNALMADDWAYQVTFSTDSEISLPENVPVNVVISTPRIAPISLILNN